MDVKNYTNNDLELGIEKIARRIVLDNWQPDLIIGILRGGIIPAVYLSHWFEIPMTAVEWSVRDNKVGCSFGDFDIEKWFNKNILIVDDICDSGITLEQVVSNLKELSLIKMDDKNLDFKTACLHYNIGQDVFAPDYYHMEINKEEDPRWIIYSWEKN